MAFECGVSWAFVGQVSAFLSVRKKEKVNLQVMSPLLFVLSFLLFFSNTERVQRHQSVCSWRIGSPRERAESNWHPCRAGGEPPPLSHGHRYGAQLHCKQFWQIERSQTLIEFWKCESLKPECSAELPWKWKGCDLLPPLWALVIRVPSWEVITRPDIVWASTIEQCAQPCRAWIHICASLICPCLEKKNRKIFSVLQIQ